MPTENRSSTIEQHDHIEGIIDMVSVPREVIQQAEKLLQEDNRCAMAREFRALLAKPAEQHQGDPVALPERKRAPSNRATTWNSRIEGFNECLDEMSKLGPLYSRPVQAETVITVITAEQVLGAYQFASFEPAKHLRGTTNWCAAFAQELNYRIGSDTAEVERIAKELRETREERDGLRRSVDEFQSRSHGIKNLSVIEQLNDKLSERDALLDRLRNHLIAKGVLDKFGPELFQILNIEAPERAVIAKP